MGFLVVVGGGKQSNEIQFSAFYVDLINHCCLVRSTVPFLFTNGMVRLTTPSTARWFLGVPLGGADSALS